MSLSGERDIEKEALSAALNARIKASPVHPTGTSAGGQALPDSFASRVVCTQQAAVADEGMAMEEPGGSGEAHLNAASEGLGADLLSAGSGESLQDASATAPVDNEVGSWEWCRACGLCCSKISRLGCMACAYDAHQAPVLKD